MNISKYNLFIIIFLILFIYFIFDKYIYQENFINSSVLKKKYLNNLNVQAGNTKFQYPYSSYRILNNFNKIKICNPCNSNKYLNKIKEPIPYNS